MAYAPLLSPLALAPTPASAPERSSKARVGIRRSINSRDRRFLQPPIATSHSKSSTTTAQMARPLTPCSLQEAEIEASIYFPTFARRGSSQTQSTQDREVEPRSLRQGSYLINDSAEEHDEIFELEDGLGTMGLEGGAEEEGEVEEEDYEGGQDAYDMPPLDLDRSAPGETRRRRSDQTASSLSSNDLDMVWEEDDSLDNSNTNSSSSRRRRTDTVLLTRTGSVSSPTNALLKRPEPRRKFSLTTTHHHYPIVTATSLPFVRRSDRVALVDSATATINNSIVPPFTNHWQAPRRGSSTSIYSRRYSTTVPSSAVSSPLEKNSPLPSYPSSPRQHTSQLPLSSASTSQRGRARKADDDRTRKDQRPRNRSHTVAASSSPSSNLSQETLLQANSTSSPSTILSGGGRRKRSSTDPIAVHPPFQRHWPQDNEGGKVRRIV